LKLGRDYARLLAKIAAEVCCVFEAECMRQFLAHTTFAAPGPHRQTDDGTGIRHCGANRNSEFSNAGFIRTGSTLRLSLTVLRVTSAARISQSLEVVS
jgi:hypothetical protein